MINSMIKKEKMMVKKKIYLKWKKEIKNVTLKMKKQKYEKK